MLSLDIKNLHILHFSLSNFLESPYTVSDVLSISLMKRRNHIYFFATEDADREKDEFLLQTKITAL